MTPAARLQAAIEILEWLDKTDQPLDRFLRDWFRARRYAGSKDRRAVGERVFSIQRRRASLAHRMGGDLAPRSLVIASLLAEGENPETFFTGGGYGPAPVTGEEHASIAAAPAEAAPWVEGEFPSFLTDELERAFGSLLLEEMRAFSERAPVDLRVNTLKASRNDVLAALMDQSLAAAPTRLSPLGIRIPPEDGAAALAKSPLFLSGAFEFQDESAQIASRLACAAPGMRVLDLAAGAGGKSLALAAMMNNEGEIVARDVREGALGQLQLRAARAGATIIRTHLSRPGEPVPPDSFDIVFVDAPCSGSGTWRRQPEIKWRITPARLAELTALQDRLLDEGAARVASRGRLVYATCSVLPCENEDRVAAFLARNPGFTVIAPALPWSAPAAPRFFRASPLTMRTDGFFCAVLGRTSNA